MASPDTCGQPPSATFDVVVPEDGVVLVLAATFDGSGLDALVLPVG